MQMAALTKWRGAIARSIDRISTGRKGPAARRAKLASQRSGGKNSGATDPPAPAPGSGGLPSPRADGGNHRAGSSRPVPNPGAKARNSPGCRTSKVLAA